MPNRHHGVIDSAVDHQGVFDALLCKSVRRYNAIVGRADHWRMPEQGTVAYAR